MNSDYVMRVADSTLQKALSRAGAVLIEGPKGSGKTEMARHHSNSFIHIDTDPQVAAMMDISPQLILDGTTPRTLDEWQVHPAIWDHVRHEVDHRKLKGQFILTGSTAPSELVARHSGAGRFARLTLGTMTFQETQHSDGAVSLSALAQGQTIATAKAEIDFSDVLERMCRGGWPGWLDLDTESAMENARDYIRTVAEVDITTPDGIRRDPNKVMRLIASLARGVGTEQSVQVLAQDSGVGRDTVGDYLDGLARIFISVDQPAWPAHPRSRDALRKAPKRHLADPALAVAALRLSPEKLMKNLEFTGQLFESQVVHELRCLSLETVFHARDTNGNEVDAIVNIGDQLVFCEIKLGSSKKTTDQAAKSLQDFSRLHSGEQQPALVIINAGNLSYTRPDGVHVVSIGNLGA